MITQAAIALVVVFSSASMESQITGARFNDLKLFLQLTDAQLSELVKSPAQRGAPGVHPAIVPPRRFPFGLREPPLTPELKVLTGDQRAKLNQIIATLEKAVLVNAAKAMGLISRTRGTWAPCLYQLGAYKELLALSDEQVSAVEDLKRAAESPIQKMQNEKYARRAWLLRSGSVADSPELIAIERELADLEAQSTQAMPRRDEVMAVLDDAQRIKMEDIESYLRLQEEADDLKLIFVSGFEVLCH